MEANELKIMALSKSEKAKVVKASFPLTNERYQTSKTSPLVFYFEAAPFLSPLLRLKRTQIQSISLEGKEIYLFDHFFLSEERDQLHALSSHADFKKAIYADQESREKGEDPDRAMDNKEKWEFFSHPPQAVEELFKWLSFLADKLEAEVSTIPWELCDLSICAPAVATNRIESKTSLSADLGKHQDYNTEKGLSFGLKVLYSKEEELHPSQFINGERGRPWLLSLMLYSTSKDFDPSYGMGTQFYGSDGKMAYCSSCKDMRFVLFEGDIVHTIEPSNFPEGVKPWRVSYVFKLVINPKRADCSLKEDFHRLMKSYHSK